MQHHVPEKDGDGVKLVPISEVIRRARGYRDDSPMLGGPISVLDQREKTWKEQLAKVKQRFAEDAERERLQRLIDDAA